MMDTTRTTRLDNAEAIKVLTKFDRDNTNNLKGEMVDAIALAIKALEYLIKLDKAESVAERLSEAMGEVFVTGTTTTTDMPPMEYAPIVRCKNCIWYHPEHIKLNDGTERPYTDDDTNELGIPHCVSVDVGINCAGKCEYRYREHCFMNEDDYCSRGEKKKNDSIRRI